MSVMKKSLVLAKMHRFLRDVRKRGNKIQGGETPRQLVIDYDNTCNFRCKFCYEQEDRAHNGEHLSLEEIADIADQAYELGIWEIIFQGGELLVDYEAFRRLLKAVRPERFRTVLVTNGYLLSKQRAEELADDGLDCVGVSISGLDAESHDADRAVPGAHQRALEALDAAASAGLTTWAQVVFGHHNAHSKDLFALLEYLKQRRLGTYFILAMPYGIYEGSTLTSEDLAVFQKIRQTYTCYFDTWDMYDPERKRLTGCWAAGGARLFITPKGDVLACPFINIRFGNVREKSLKEIHDAMTSIRYFGSYSPICLAGQDRAFRKKYLDGIGMSMFQPKDACEVFKNKEDFLR